MRALAPATRPGKPCPASTRQTLPTTTARLRRSLKTNVQPPSALWYHACNRKRVIAAAALPTIAPRTQSTPAAATTSDASQPATPNFGDALQAVVKANSAPAEDGKKPQREKSDPKDASVTTTAPDPTQLLLAPVLPPPVPQPLPTTPAAPPTKEFSLAPLNTAGIPSTPTLPVQKGALSTEPALPTPPVQTVNSQPPVTPPQQAAPQQQPHIDVPPATQPTDTSTLPSITQNSATPASKITSAPAEVTAKALTAALPLPSPTPAAPMPANPTPVANTPAVTTTPAVPAATIHQLSNLIQANNTVTAPLPPVTNTQQTQQPTDPSPGSTTSTTPISANTDPKQHAQSGSNSSNSQDNSNQGPTSSSQSTPTPQPAAPVHFTVAPNHTQDAPVAAAQTQNIPAPPTPLVHDVAKSPRPAVPSAPAADPSLPTINTARLIQTANQSEMRVGLRSTDFGNISISTSTTRDTISAQISLDHGELAKTLVAHLPEMQARLGGERPMEVRIDMNGQSTGQSMGQAPSQGQGNSSSATYSSNTRQPRVEQDTPAKTLAQPVMEASAARLDIRI
jgi:hypothetical protein